MPAAEAASEKANKIFRKNSPLVAHLGTVQVLVFLQQFICLLYRHFIVAIIKVICRKTRENNTLSVLDLNNSCIHTHHNYTQSKYNTTI